MIARAVQLQTGDVQACISFAGILVTVGTERPDEPGYVPSIALSYRLWNVSFAATIIASEFVRS